MKKGQLYSYHRQIEQWKKEHNVLVELNKGRIRDFYKENAIHLEAVEESILKLKQEYFVIEDERIKMDGDKYVFLEGKTEYSFDENWKALMKQTVGTKFKSEHYDEPVAEPVEEVKAEA